MNVWLFQLLTALLCMVAGAWAPDPELSAKSVTSRQKILNPAELESEYWQTQAQQQLRHLLYQDQSSSHAGNRTAKNVILFMGDGMSIHTLTATRSYLGDPSKQLSFEKFPYFGLSKTYCVDAQVADSACTATAYLAGVKGNYGTIGVNARVPRKDCKQGQKREHHTDSIAKWAQDAGKWAGLVTNARVTHASPAGVYAHTADRKWESDAALKKAGCDPSKVVDIARQLVEWPVGRGLRVILGGGRYNFLNKTVLDEEGKPGERTDGRNLIEEWLDDKHRSNASAQYVATKIGLLQAREGKPDYLLGLFNSSHCPYHGNIERQGIAQVSPSLSDMTEAAIDLLSRSKQGFFLFVEGALIDMAHHDTRARKALEETAEFARAVELARNRTSAEDTLIVVTADHAHTMSIGGYPGRYDDILGLNPEKAKDKLPYSILSYANGEGYENTYSRKRRKDLKMKNFKDPEYGYMATVPLNSETHGGEDVGVFASGPQAHYFSGNYEQTNIPLLMAKAANIGPYSEGSCH